MTPEREKEIRSACERTAFDREMPGDSPGEMARDLLDEIDRLRSDFRAESLARGRTTVALAEAREEMDRLRRLPVISTCGECGHVGFGDYCSHPRFDGLEKHERPELNHDAAPPEWCPLREVRDE